MDHKIRKSGESIEVSIVGDLTFFDHEAFRSVLAVFDDPESRNVVFDLSKLSSVDSSGLGMFMVARNTAEIKNVSLTVRGAQGHVKKMLHLGKFDDLFDGKSS